jgi:hypothetical protein
MSGALGAPHDGRMKHYLLYHRHEAGDCAASFASWNGFPSGLRRSTARSTCAFGGHEIWWSVTAESEQSALANLPTYVAGRTLAVRVADVEIL